MRPTTNVPSKLLTARPNYNFLLFLGAYKFDTCYGPFSKIVVLPSGCPTQPTCCSEDTMACAFASHPWFRRNFAYDRRDYNPVRNLFYRLPSRDSSGVPLVNMWWVIEMWEGQCPAPLFQPWSFPRHLGPGAARSMNGYLPQPYNAILTHQLGIHASVSPQGTRSVALTFIQMLE
jgi:hypothetical protein